MPALWSPKDLAVRFAPYIEELHDVFVMHGVRYGSPDDICQLAERLQKPGPLNEELAALVRSMVLREGGSLPRTDLLEIVAIAIAGPRMDPAGEELQPSVRQLLAFLHSALRRPWNEPPGEERLHPDEDPRAEAARELREAAAKIEAEVQGAGRDRQVEMEPEEAIAAHTAPANVIPFGRARAVFSRLARAEAAEPLDNDEASEPQIAISAIPVVENHIIPAPSAQMAQETNVTSLSVPPTEAAPPDVHDQSAHPVIISSALGMDEDQVAVLSTAPGEATGEGADIASAPAAMTEAHAEPILATPDAALHGLELPEIESAAAAASPSMIGALVPLTEPALSGADSRNAAPIAPTAVPVVPASTSAERVPLQVPHVARSIRRETIPSIPLPEFDEEPPLPAAPHITRAVFVYGIAAVVLLAAGLGFALRTGSATQAAANPIAMAKPVEASGAARTPVVPPVDSVSKPDPAAGASVAQPGHGAHFDDDYIAPPYSNAPPQEDSSAAVAAPIPDRLSVSLANDKAAAAEHPVVEEVSEVSAAATRPRDPDAMIVGDGGSRTSTVALAEPPPHPHISAGLMAENLVSAPKPDYPALAKIAHVDGPVVLHAEINRKGEVSDTQVISGHFLLRRAAEAAVKHWRYRPYQVDGKSVPVSTTITVRFRH